MNVIPDHIIHARVSTYFLLQAANLNGKILLKVFMVGDLIFCHFI